MEGYLYSKNVPLFEVGSSLSESSTLFSYLIQESQSEIRFDCFGVPEEDWQPWERGRAFGPELEIRWQEMGEQLFQLLALSDVPRHEFDRKGWKRKEVEAGGDGRIYLWGRHRSFLTGMEEKNGIQEWLQAGIPRVLQYPLDMPLEFVYIQTRMYRRNGVLILTRFCGIEGENSKETKR